MCKNKNKGITLIEMLITCFIFVTIMLLSTKSIMKINEEIPRTHRDFLSNSTISVMLRHLQKDIENSNGILEYTKDNIVIENTLLIDSDDGLITYIFDKDKVTKLLPYSDPDKSSENSWHVPNAKFDWNILQHNGKGYAIEITSCIKRKFRDRWREKLKNSHIYFSNAAIAGEK